MGAVTIVVQDKEGNKSSPLVLPYTVAAASSAPLIGTTQGSLGVVKSVGALPGCETARVYQGNQPTTIAADNALTFLKNNGIQIEYTFGAMPVKTQFQTLVADWMKAGVPFWWTYRNEVDGSSMTPTAFTTAYDQLQQWAEAVPGYAASKVRDQPVYMSYMLTAGSPHGDPELWLPTRPTRLAFDCYTLHTAALARDFCKAHGLPWTITEMGSGGTGGEVPPGWTQAQYDADRDGGAKAWAQNLNTQVLPAYPPQGEIWYASTQGANSRSNTLVALPKTAAYLSTLAAK